jgi:signal transduction histidine kinase
MNLVVARLGLAKKYILFILIAFILIFGAGLGAAYYIFKDSVRETLNENQNTASFLSKLIFEHQKATLGIIQSYALRPLLLEAIKRKNVQAGLPHLRNLVEKNPEVEQVFITDKEGILWANYPPFMESPGGDLSKRDWYQSISKEWKPYVSDVYKRATGGGDLVVAVCTPVLDREGNVLGIFGTNQRTLLLAKLSREAKLNPAVKITLVDRAGQIIFSDKLEDQKQIALYQPFTVLRKVMEEGGTHAEIEGPNGKGKLKYVAFAPVKEFGWSVFVEKGRAEIIGSNLFEFALIAGISLILFALAIVGSIYFVQKDDYLSKLRHLSSQILNAQETERKRIAHELHDSLLSEMAGLSISLDSKITALKVGKSPDLTGMEEIMSLLRNIIQDTRAIMNNLRPSILDELGISPTLTWFCREFKKRYPQICIDCQIKITEAEVEDSLKIVIFRVFQEATHNFIKHGDGTKIELSLEKKERAMKLEIRDNGQGFNLYEVRKGVGLSSMRERVESSGGEFQIDSGIGKGTTIRAIWSSSA